MLFQMSLSKKEVAILKKIDDVICGIVMTSSIGLERQTVPHLKTKIDVSEDFTEKLFLL